MDVRDMTEDDIRAMTLTLEAIGGTGAHQAEIGSNDEGAHWYASATLQGARVSCELQRDPLAAVLGLYAMLVAGGLCLTCERNVALVHSDVGLIDGARMRDGVFETHVAADPRRFYCVRVLGPDGWSACRRG